jgi:hypothetical protein
LVVAHRATPQAPGGRASPGCPLDEGANLIHWAGILDDLSQIVFDSCQPQFDFGQEAPF